MIRLLLLAGACYLSYRAGQENGMRMARGDAGAVGARGEGSNYESGDSGYGGSASRVGAGGQGSSRGRDTTGVAGSDAEVMSPIVTSTS